MKVHKNMFTLVKICITMYFSLHVNAHKKCTQTLADECFVCIVKHVTTCFIIIFDFISIDFRGNTYGFVCHSLEDTHLPNFVLMENQTDPLILSAASMGSLE